MGKLNTIASGILLIAVLVGLVVCACSEDSGEEYDQDSDGDKDAEKEETELAADDPPDEKACSFAIVSNGFGLRWKNLNHRVSWFKIQPGADECDSSEENKTMLNAAFIGGDFSTGETMEDVPAVSYSGNALDAPGYLGFYNGAVEFDLQAPENQSQIEIELSLKKINLLGFDQYVVLINGIELDTRVDQGDDYPDNYKHEHGYTSRGIGAWLSEPQLGEGMLSFNAGLRFDHGPSDRENMNEAMLHARTKGILYYVLVGVEDGAVASAESEYRLIYPESEIMHDQLIEHASMEQRTISISTVAGLAEKFLGWTAFNFELDPEASADPEGSGPIGYYIRDYSIRASIIEINEDKDEALVDIDGYVSNASAFVAYYPLDSRFSGRIALVQIPETTKEQIALEQEFETGEISIPLLEE